MGGHPYWYFVPYQPDILHALQSLREREFKAGRYNPAEDFPRFPVDLKHAPGAQHASIDDAIEDADADGTRSILDLCEIGEAPEFNTAVPLDGDALEEFFGTTRPERAQIEANMDFLEEVERGQGVYIIAYKDDEPSEIFFAGYSFD